MATVTLPHYGALQSHSSDYGPYVWVPNSSGGQSRVCPELVWAVVVAYWLAGLSDKLVWTQGGLNQGAVDASAQVHDGLCVADLRTTNMTDEEVWKVATWLLRCGVIANIRGVVDKLADHFHCVMANPKHGHQTAKAQVREYLDGGDGLVGDRPFYGPKVPFTTWEDSPYFGLDDLDMAEPKDVWKVDVEPGAKSGPAGEVLWSTLERVREVPTAAAIAAEVIKQLQVSNLPSPAEWRKEHPDQKTWSGLKFWQYTFDPVHRIEKKLDLLARVVAAVATESQDDEEFEANVEALLGQLVQGDEPDPMEPAGPPPPQT